MLNRLLKIKPLHAAIIWLAWLMVWLVLLITQVSSIQIETNILALLPQEQQHSDIVKKALQQRQQHQQTSVFLIPGKSNKEAVEHAQLAAKKMQDSGIFSQVQLQIDDSKFAHQFQENIAYRYQLLSDNDSQAIQQEPDDFLQRGLNALYSPVGIQRAAVLAIDPIFTYSGYLETLNSNNSFELYNDVAVIQHQKLHYALITTELSSGPVAKVNTMQAYTILLQLYRQQEQWANANNMPIYRAGLPLYNAFAAEGAEKEISTVGLFSLLGIVLLIFYCFRSTLPLVLALTSIGTGVIAAFSVCHLLFDRIHIITLVFGSSLIGISIDYAFHYFAEFFNQNNDTSQQRLTRIFTGISLGMLSSVLAYSALAFAPFPGLQQIAVFSAMGLFSAWLTVCLFHPLALFNYEIKRQLPLSSFYRIYTHAWPQVARQYKYVLLAVTLLYSVFGFYLLIPVDDIRQIQKPEPQLLAQEEKIKSLVNIKQDSQFFIISADDKKTLLDNEAVLTSALSTLIDNKQLKSYSALSDLYPNPLLQKQNYQLLEQQIFQSHRLYQQLQMLGMDTADIKTIYDDFHQSSNQQLSFEQWLRLTNTPIQEQFLGCDIQCSSIITLTGIKDLNALSSIGQTHANIVFVDQVASINQILLKYRQLAVWFILFAIVAITLLLSLILGVRSALHIIITPITAIILTVASLVYVHADISLFNVFALLLVLGISLDYAIFHHLGGEHKNTTALAILLSLITTLLAFGLLALSSTAVVHAFGLTLAIGLIMAFIIAPLLPTKVTWVETAKMTRTSTQQETTRSS